MTRRGAGDVLLFQMVSRRAWRAVLLALLALIAAASLYLRVWLGRPGGVLPWWGAILGLYGLAMIVVSRDRRSRTAWGALSLLAMASFARALPAGPVDNVRLRGAIEAAAALTLAAMLVSLSRDRGMGENAVLESPPSRHPGDDPPAERQQPPGTTRR